ncbi:hypothetical protein HNP46_006380 [Pseudomonas nitritireducens]|uniref:Uncharacterized protein n=1 Tax=Pseudomonas nitroreducens TaxID=46680 RepID=A0A7W7KRD2_PSENT|nr:hypothetical protein [Pseudomonas nitritireducens]MBB4867467.1 hypothetical protein [Pseudomonas nitritireducens]
MMPSPSKAYYSFHNANADRLMHRDGLLDGITGILDAVSPGDRVAILVLALFDGDYLLAKYLLDEYGEVELSFEPGERAFTYRHGEFDGSFEYSSVVNDWMCWLQDHQVDDFFALILRCKAYGLVGLAPCI